MHVTTITCPYSADTVQYGIFPDHFKIYSVACTQKSVYHMEHQARNIAFKIHLTPFCMTENIPAVVVRSETRGI
jgi:hypothetical protein